MSCTGQEGSDTVALVKAFIPDKWRAGSATSAPVCAATAMNFTAVCEEDADFDAIPEPTSQVLRAPGNTSFWLTLLHTWHITGRRRKPVDCGSLKLLTVCLTSGATVI